MLFRTLLLLFSTCLVALECSKVNEILQKKVGKRFFDAPNLWNYANPEPKLGRWNKNCFRDPECAFNKASEEEVWHKKLKTIRTVLSTIFQAASKENLYYDQASKFLEGLMEWDMTAEICEERGNGSKKLNRYQYMKYRHQTAALFEATPRIKWYFQVQEGLPRKQLRVMTNIVQWDKKFNLMAQIHYDIIMKFKPELYTMGSYFSITHINQGGICPENGALIFDRDDEIDGIIDDLEQLQNHPTARTLIGFFTPLAYQFTDPEYRRVPSFWITGLEKDVSKFFVCQEQAEESQEYTHEEFRNWYRRFGIMWHPEKDKEDDFISIKVLEIKPDQIIAYIIMKLQLGLGEKFYEWNFKVQGAKNTSIANSTWYIDRLEVPCNADFIPKDQTFGAIGDVIATTFVEDLVELPDPTQWYSTVAFVKRFTNHGFKGFKYCDHEKLKTNTPILDLFIFDRNVLRINKFTKYWIDHTDDTRSAEDSATVKFRTISSQSRDIKLEYENEWKFDVKWDPLDHFWYVEFMEIGCHKPINDGKYDEGVKYIDIDYGFEG